MVLFNPLLEFNVQEFKCEISVVLNLLTHVNKFRVGTLTIWKIKPTISQCM